MAGSLTGKRTLRDAVIYSWASDLVSKHTSEGERLFERGQLMEGGAKSNYYLALLTEQEV